MPTFLSFFTPTCNFSRALSQFFSRVYCFLFWGRKLHFSCFARENVSKIPNFRKFSRAFLGNFCMFFTGSLQYSREIVSFFFTSGKKKLRKKTLSRGSRECRGIKGSRGIRTAGKAGGAVVAEGEKEQGEQSEQGEQGSRKSKICRG